MMRNFKPMVESVERWQQSQLSDVSAKMNIYRAFVEAELEAPRHLDRKVHDTRSWCFQGFRFNNVMVAW